MRALFRLIFLGVILSVVGCGKPVRLVDHPSSVAVLVIGDSISAGYGIDPELGWVRLLEKEWRAQGRIRPDQVILNRSVSGATSADGLRDNEARLAKDRPAVLVIALGGNDGLRRLSPEAMADNLTRLAQAGTEAGSIVVLVGVDWPGRLAFLPSARYRDALKSVTARADVVLVDNILENLSGDELQADGIHPSVSGQGDLMKSMKSALDEAIQKAGRS